MFSQTQTKHLPDTQSPHHKRFIEHCTLYKFALYSICTVFYEQYLYSILWAVYSILWEYLYSILWAVIVKYYIKHIPIAHWRDASMAR